jgi:transcriptional regulator with XRE-family HTH domain
MCFPSRIDIQQGGSAQITVTLELSIEYGIYFKIGKVLSIRVNGPVAARQGVDRMFREEMIGRRIRHLRLQRGMTQEVLARSAGLSTGYLSKIETSESPPPVSTLVNIADALGVVIGDLFADQEFESKTVIVRESERQVLEYKGATYNPLAFQFANRHMEPMIIRIPTEAGRIDERDRPGEGLLFILDGRVRVIADDTTEVLGKGDFAYFTLGIPRSIESLDGEAIALAVLSFGVPPERVPDGG